MKKKNSNLFFSIIIPVYNRPEEVRELLQSLTKQHYQRFEVIIIEDGSSKKCELVVQSFSEQLDITYVYKENSGQGFSRNVGFKKAKGDYFIMFDSDCLIPSHYLETVHNHLQKREFDAYGGPDKAHKSFSILQKAISYSMTSPFTTGGIRGNEKHSGQFHPRSFNMGISRDVFEATGGFKITRMGEDIIFSIDIINEGFKTGLISAAFVYHKRRTSLTAFFKQLHFFGRARVHIGRFYPSEIKWVHLLPVLFVMGVLFTLTLPLWYPTLFFIIGLIGVLLFLILGTHATIKTKSAAVGLMSMLTSFIQITAYGLGFLSEYTRENKNKN
jgi:glycosyltransferase involved in cell wall biosynthesis